MTDVTAPPLGQSPLLQRLRKKYGMSQRVFAEKCGISRGRLRRLEGKEFSQVTYAELKRISETLSLGVGELFLGSEISAKNFHFGKKGESVFRWDAASAGYKIVSLVPARKDLFIGKLFIAGKKRLTPSHTPRAKTVFLQVLLGKFRVETAEQTCEMGEGDRLLFEGENPYSLENPLLRDSEALLLTLPAFRA